MTRAARFPLTLPFRIQRQKIRLEALPQLPRPPSILRSLMPQEAAREQGNDLFQTQIGPDGQAAA